MEAYAKVLLWAIPVFFGLVVFEILYGYFKKKQTYSFMDTIASLSSGITNVIKDSLGLAVALISYPFLLEYLAVTEIQKSIWLYTIAFICIDFASYWSHRLNHSINLFWNQHVIHHSSEEFNLACALRQSISNIISFNAAFLIPAAFFGVPAVVINVLAPLHLFGQFWYHTRHIGKLGVLEYIFVTPSQHRVHHAINPIYIDKNLGAIFCIWDRVFGTFQEELDSEPPIYGTLKPVSTWNPIWINFIHFWGLVQDAWRTKNILDKFKIWFMPTGWRPGDVRKRFPRQIIEDVYKQSKYRPAQTFFNKIWVVGQFTATNLLLFFLLNNFELLGNELRILFGVLIALNIFGYSMVMDNFRKGIYFKILFDVICLLLITASPAGEVLLQIFPMLFGITVVIFSVSLLSLYIFDKKIEKQII